MPTTEHSVPLTQSMIMPLACYTRRRSHLCSLSVPDCKMFGCRDLLQLCATCRYQKLSATLDKQPVLNVVITVWPRDSTEGDLMKGRKGTKAVMRFRLIYFVHQTLRLDLNCVCVVPLNFTILKACNILKTGKKTNITCTFH